MFGFAKRKVANFFRGVVREAVAEALEQDACQIDRHLQRLAVQSSAAYILEHMPLEKGLPHRDKLFDVCLAETPARGLILEFGVYRGHSIRYLAERVPDREVFGFDSFEGLREPGRSHHKS